MTAGITITARGGHPDFLDLPWGQPLEHWDHPRLVTMAHGVSRHIVRFVRYDDRVYALKETEENVARSEYATLRDLRERHLPVVEPVGVVTGQLPGGEATLITRYLDFSLPYWYLLGRDEPGLADNLVRAGVVLLVTLHLERVYWGDCSLSNMLFRRDAGAMMAYLVDAETTERNSTLSDALRHHDLEITKENIIGGLLDLQAAERVGPDVDPIDVADDFHIRYDELWDQLTRVDEFDLGERWRIDHRVRQINELGFDVEELTISTDGTEIRVKPVVLEEGHHARNLRRKTGLEVQENQARRLLCDIENFRAWLEHESGTSVPEAVGAARWLADVYDPLVESIPKDLRSRLEPPEIFHNLLEHRYYMSQQQHRGVANDEALDDYLLTILEQHPTERQLDPSEVGSDLPM